MELLEHIEENWESLAFSSGAIVLGALVGLVAHWLLHAILQRAAARSRAEIDDSVLRHARGPTRLLMPTVGVYLAASSAELSDGARALVLHLVSITLIAGMAWLVVRLAMVAEDVVERRYRLDVQDNLAARRVRTQFAVVRRIVVVVVTIIAVAAMLMTFPRVKQLGASMLASAGLAGLVLGMAARPALSNILAGVQLALTQPIRLDDVLVVNGEWGRVEEIGSTYVVLRIWDKRRLVIPLNYFIENPIENWTRHSADIIGVVYVYADYTADIEAVRAELKSILDTSGMWDGQAWSLAVTDVTGDTLQLRAIMSAPDSGTAWNLRCHVREKLVAFIQAHPDWLPRTRADLAGHVDLPAPPAGRPNEEGAPAQAGAPRLSEQ